MTRTVVALLTLGDPARMTGGYLYHRRLADRAAASDVAVRFASVPAIPFPVSAGAGPAWLSHDALAAADVVVLDSIAAAPAAPWLRFVHRPLVAMAHQPAGGIDHGRARRLLEAPFDLWAYRRCRVVIAASDWLAEQLAGQGVPRRRVTVIPPGRDVEADAGREPRQGGPSTGDLRAGRRMAALSVANWVPRKGIAELLDAVAALAPNLVTLHLVGDAAADLRYARQVRARLAQSDLAGRVVVHGVVDPSRMSGWYRAADAFVLPSFEEPYGTVWGEAMAAGLPVVGWRAGNLPFLAEHDREGLLVPVGDVAGLTDAIRQLAESDELRVRLGAAAARRAADRPTWDETAARFFAVLRRVAAQGAG